MFETLNRQKLSKTDEQNFVKPFMYNIYIRITVENFPGI